MRAKKRGDEEKGGFGGLEAGREVSHESILRHHVGISLFFGVDPERVEQREQRHTRAIGRGIQAIQQKRNRVLHEFEEVRIVFHVDTRFKLHPDGHKVDEGFLVSLIQSIETVANGREERTAFLRIDRSRLNPESKIALSEAVLQFVHDVHEALRGLRSRFVQRSLPHEHV